MEWMEHGRQDRRSQDVLHKRDQYQQANGRRGPDEEQQERLLFVHIRRYKCDQINPPPTLDCSLLWNLLTTRCTQRVIQQLSKLIRRPRCRGIADIPGFLDGIDPAEGLTGFVVVYSR